MRNKKQLTWNGLERLGFYVLLIILICIWFIGAGYETTVSLKDCITKEKSVFHNQTVPESTYELIEKKCMIKVILKESSDAFDGVLYGLVYCGIPILVLTILTLCIIAYTNKQEKKNGKRH